MVFRFVRSFIYNRNSVIAPQRYFVVFCAVLLAFFNACDAPRENPLDPDNPDAKLAVLTGTVQTYSSPRKGLADALVIRGGEVIAKTNAAGEFTASYINPLDAWYSFQCTGYTTDSVYLAWSGRKSVNLEMLLNQKPVMDSIFVYSSVKSGFSTAQTKYELIVKTKISDKDGDIDSVFLYNEEYQVRLHLPYNINDKAFEGTFTPTDFELSNLVDIIGTPLSILVKDQSGRTTNVGVGYLKRILSDGVPATSPQNLETVGSSPELKWDDIAVSYLYTFMLQVYSADEFPQTLAWQKEGITPSDSTRNAYVVDKTLSAGSYYWIVWRVDNNLNRISSTPLSFIVR